MVNSSKTAGGLYSQLFRLSAAQKVLAAHPLAALQLHLQQFQRTLSAGDNQLFAVDHCSGFVASAAAAIPVVEDGAVHLEQLAVAGGVRHRPGERPRIRL